VERFGFILSASVLHDDERLNRLIADYTEALEQLGGERWPDGQCNRPAPLLIFVVTGGTEQKILRLWERRQAAVPHEPVFLLAHPGHNSLPAALEVLARLRQDGARGRIFILNGPDDSQGLQHIAAAIHDLAVYHALRQERLGLIGAPSDWLVASSPAPDIVRERWGPEVLPIPLDEVYRAMRAIPPEDTTPLLDSLISGADEVREPSRAALQDGVRVYLALKQVVKTHALSALTLRCFDLVLRLKTTGCLALAQLNDEGLIAGCEGDLVSAVGMLWAARLLDSRPWMANPARLDEVRNTLWLAHCTVPRRLTQSYRLRSHFESGLGVGVQGTLPTGFVTLLRIGGKEMEQLWLAEGEILRTGDAADLCRTQVEIRLSAGHITELLYAPLGNHLVLIAGHHAQQLAAWWEMMVSRATTDARS